MIPSDTTEKPASPEVGRRGEPARVKARIVARRRPDFRRIAIAFTAALVVVVVTVALNPVRYQVNDDPWIQGVVSGRFTGHPSALTGITSVFFTGPISWLYRIAGGVPWYPLVLIGGWVICLGIVFDLILAATDDLAARLIAGATVSALALPSIAAPAYTSLAVGVGTSGLLVAACATKATSTRRLWLAAALVIASSVVRWHAFLTVFVAGFTLVVFAAWQLRKRLLPMAVAMVVLISVLHVADAKLERRGPWKAFVAFNTPRGDLHDTGRLETMPPKKLAALLARAGWTRNDLHLFDAWFFSDPQVFTTKSVRILDHGAPATRHGDAWHALTPFDRFLSRYFSHETALVVFLAALLAVALALRRRGRWLQLGLAALATTAWVYLVGALLLTFYRMTLAMTAPLFFLVGAALVLALLATRADAKHAGARRVQLVAAVAMAAVLAAVSVNGWALHREYQAYSGVETAQADVTLSMMRSLGPRARFLIVGLPFPWSGLSPWSGLKQLDTVHYVATGWDTFSPTDQAMRRRARLGNNLFAALLKRNTYLVASSPVVPYVEEYYHQHRHETVKLAPALPNTGELVTIYRVTSIR